MSENTLPDAVALATAGKNDPATSIPPAPPAPAPEPKPFTDQVSELAPENDFTQAMKSALGYVD